MPEFRFKIDAGYSAETMPLARLAEYLQALATVLGEKAHIHLLRVESSSAVPVLNVDEEAAERVRDRGAAVRSGTAPIDAMAAYRSLNRMLAEDKGRGSFHEAAAEIIPFPGVEAVTVEPIAGIPQQGTIEGELEKVGGPRDWAPVHLRTADRERITGCFARKALIQQLAPLIYQPVRLYGHGRWGRSSEGQWAVERFFVDSFEPLDRAPLADVVAALRKVKSDWSENAVAQLAALRHGDERE